MRLAKRKKIYRQERDREIDWEGGGRQRHWRLRPLNIFSAVAPRSNFDLKSAERDASKSCTLIWIENGEEMHIFAFCLLFILHSNLEEFREIFDTKGYCSNYSNVRIR